MNPVGAGAIGTIAFGVLFYLCAPHSARHIEQDLTQRARSALLRAGFPADGLDLSGRDAVLAGPRGSIQTSWQAIRIVSEVQGIRRVEAQAMEPVPADTPLVADPSIVATIHSELNFLTRRDIEFEPNTANLTAQGQAVLDDVAEVLKKYSQFPVEVQGYADNIGDPATAMELSRRRAATVRIYLIAKGVASSQLTAAGYGQSTPRAGAKAGRGRAPRRIELVVRTPR